MCSARPNRDGTRGPGYVLNDDGSDKENPPNVAGNMTDDEKAELGGAGSGTPGGWGPDDEGKARGGENASQNDSGKFEGQRIVTLNNTINTASCQIKIWRRRSQNMKSKFPSTKGI